MSVLAEFVLRGHLDHILEEIQEDYVKEMLRTKPEESKTREQLYSAVQALEDVKHKLQDCVNYTGDTYEY